MAHSNSRIYIDQNTTGVEIADIQQVLGTSDNDLGLLCADKTWDRTQTPAVLVDANRINPMAKYKPVRHAKIGILTNAERSSARYGFGGGLLPTLNLAQNIPQNDLEYLPPRGKGGGDGGADEWYRIRDFEGYSHGACFPLALTIGQLVYDGESQILLFGNEMSNSIREDGRTWVADQSLSITEILTGNQSANGYYISFLFVDTNDYAKTLIVTNKTMADFVGSEYSQYIFKVYAEGGSDSGLTCPAVPLLSQSRSGHAFVVIACLMPGNYPSSGNAYAVYSADNTPGFLSLHPYSLGFVAGSDRAEMTLGSGAFRLDGLVVDSVTVSYVDMITEITYNGFVYRAFSVQVAASLNTMDAAAWSGTEMTVRGMLTITNGNSFIFGPSPDPNDGGDSRIEVGTATSVMSKRSGQNKQLFSAGNDKYLWVMKYNGALLSTAVTASVVFSEPLDTPTTPKSGTTTIS